MAASNNGNNGGTNRYQTSPISSDDDSEAALFAPLHQLATTQRRRRTVAPFTGVARRRPPVALMNTGGSGHRPAASSTPTRPAAEEAVPRPQPPATQPPPSPTPPPPPPAVVGPSLEQLRELFRCNVCGEYEPVRGYGSQCEHKHRVCRPCAIHIRDEALNNPYGAGDRCPYCRGAWRFTFMMEINTVFMEQVADLIPFDCLNIGCTYTASAVLMRQHQETCTWRQIKCPLVYCRKFHAAITMVDGHLLRDHRLQEFELPQRIELQCSNDEDVELADNREEASWCFVVAIKPLAAGAPVQKLLVQCIADKLGGRLYATAHNLVSGLLVDQHITINLGAAHQSPITRVLRNFSVEQAEISAKDRATSCLVLPYTPEDNILNHYKQNAGLLERYFELTIGVEYTHSNADLMMVNQPIAVRLRPVTQNRLVRRRLVGSERDSDYEPPAQAANTGADTTHISITYSDDD